jgi:hypothetical protein
MKDDKTDSTEKALLEVDLKALGKKLETVHARMTEIDAFSAPSRASAILNGLGFSKERQAMVVSLLELFFFAPCFTPLFCFYPHSANQTIVWWLANACGSCLRSVRRSRCSLVG